MAKHIDITGNRYGRLTVIKLNKEKTETQTNKDGSKIYFYDCLCDCGNDITIRKGYLTNGHTKSCGCLSLESRTKTHLKDLTGMKYGKLTVIKRGDDLVGETGLHHVQWWCKCDCGNPELVLVPRYSLERERVTSCGCDNLNTYDLSNGYGIGYTYNKDSFGRQEFYFDLDDYDKIKNTLWKFGDEDYLQGYNKEIGDNIRLHQVILPTDSKHVIDHIGGHTTRNDNRKLNLRISTSQENSRNHRIRRNNTSGVSGVYFNKTNNNWVAQITIDYKTISLGNFEDFESAVKARKEAEEKYFKDFSYDNSQQIYIKEVKNEFCNNNFCVY